MVFRVQGQRRGRVFYWVCGLLLVALLGLVGYQWWINLDRLIQDDARVDKLNQAELDSANTARTTPAQADPRDWPQWRGLHRDAHAPGDGLLLKEWPKDGLKQLWDAKGGGGFSAISVVGDRLVTMVQKDREEQVVCWQDTGQEAHKLWTFSYDSYFSQDGVGPRATPTIDGDHVYTLGPNGHLHCLSLADGKKVWAKHLEDHLGGSRPRWGFSSSPLVVDDLLLVSPGGDHAVVALDRKTGAVKAKADLSGHPGYSSPVLCEVAGQRQVLFFLGEELVGLDPKTLEVFWHFPWETKHQVNAATPIVVKDSRTGDGYVFISSGYGKGCALVCVSKGSDGKPQGNGVYEGNLMRNHFGSSVYHNGYLYGFDEGMLVCLNVKLDKRRELKREWKERGFNRGTLLVAGDRLIVLGENGDLALVDPTPEQYRELARFSVTKGKCWTMPTVARGRLYLRDEEKVYCFDLSAQ